ncbi:hypothetical protein AB6D68_01335 [Vibrio cyclitrophicus]
MTKQYNQIYNKLVKKPEDVFGIVAYSVYKRQKIDFINQATSEDGKEHPTKEELATFTEISNSEPQLAFYEEAAASLLQNYTDITESESLKEIETDYNEQLAQNKKEYERKLRNAKSTNFFYGVAQSMVASGLVILALGVLTFFVWSTQLGIKPVIEQVWGIQILDQSYYEELLQNQLADKPNEITASQG